ncbi:MAG: hypothetical protein WDA02_11085 [Saccharofermentanales bacterium]
MKYKLDESGFFKYLTINNPISKIYYIDMETSKSIDDNGFNPFSNTSGITSYPQVISPVVKYLTIDKYEFKNIKISEIHKLYEDVLNYYIDNTFDINELGNKYFNISITDSVNIIISKIYSVSNFMSHKSRSGTNIRLIIPKKLEFIIKNDNNFKRFKYYINETDIHQDKIFILSDYLEGDQIGISVFTDTELNGRLLKIHKILKKDIEISYQIMPIGSLSKYTIGIINIIN